MNKNILAKPRTYIIAITVIVIGWIVVGNVLNSSDVVGDNKYKNADDTQSIVPERVEFETDDNVNIVGDWYESEDGNKGTVVLLHMMNRDRSSWAEFAEILVNSGYNALAIDLRGHGDSVVKKGETNKSILDYREFTDEEHQSSIKDVYGALDYLKTKKSIGVDEIYIVGASIGANLALVALKSEPNLKKAVLLSPGIDYRGIISKSAISNLYSNQKVLMLAGVSDEYSANSVRELSKLAPDRADMKIFSNIRTGHGTDMFATEPDLANMILNWM